MSSTSESDFGTPDLSENITDFGFDYTSNVSRFRNPHMNIPRRQTSRFGTATNPTARKSTTRPQRPVDTTTRRPRKSRPLSKKDKATRLLQQINQLRNCTENMIPKLPFARLVKEIVYTYSDSVQRITPEALLGLQEATEMYLAEIFEDAYTLSLHRQRVTLMPKDMILLMFLRKTI